MALKPPTVTRGSNSFFFDYGDEGVTITIDRLREAREGAGLSGEITVKYLDETLHWCRINLASSSAKEGLARSLQKAHAWFWPVAIGEVCHKTASAFRAARPTVNLAQVNLSQPSGFAIRPLLPKGHTSLLYGDGSAGKGWIALWLAMIYSQNLPLPYPFSVPESGNVLYCDWETDEETTAERLERMQRGMGAGAGNIFYRRMTQPILDQIAEIQDEIARLGVSFVILDSLGAAAAGELLDPAIAIRTMDGIRELGCTRLILHHMSAENAKNHQVAGRPFGSTFFFNYARNIWELRKNDESSDDDSIRLALHHTKANLSRRHRYPIGLEVEFDDDIGTVSVKGFDVADDPELSLRTSLSQRIRHALASGKADAGTIAEDLGEDVDSVRKTLNRNKGKMFTLVEGGGGRGNPSFWANLAKP